MYLIQIDIAIKGDIMKYKTIHDIIKTIWAMSLY